MSFCGLGRAAAFVALWLLGAAASGTAHAAETNAVFDLHYATAITEFYGSTVPIEGVLDLRIDSHGIVQGNYHPEGVRNFDPVSGGRDGVHIWFDIGATADMHVTGTIAADGTIDGQAWNDSIDQSYRFTAKPVPAPSPSPVSVTASPPDFAPRPIGAAGPAAACPCG
jgi:hypothetical protein